MKIRFLLPLLFIFSAILAISVDAQEPSAAFDNRSLLIILVRHAEKADDSQDTELSAEGKARAERLVKAIGKYRPGAFYSTDRKSVV